MSMDVYRYRWILSLILASTLHFFVFMWAAWEAEQVIHQPDPGSTPIAITLAPLAMQKSIANDAVQEASRPQTEKIPVPQPQKLDVEKMENGDLASQPEDLQDDEQPTEKEQTDDVVDKEQPLVEYQQRSVEMKEDRQDEDNSAEVQGQSSTVQQQIIDSWQNEVLAHLMRYKRYPMSAKKRHQQGTVLVSFHIDALGYVSNIEIIKKSVFPLLNREAEAVISRSLPLPLPPEDLLAENSTIVVPINFFLL